jgi:hypothetical protein
MIIKDQKVLVVIYPYKFSEFLWQSLELDEFSSFIQVEVWDISLILNRKFSKGIYAPQIERENVKQFKSFLELVAYVAKFRAKYKKSDKYFINEIPLASIKSIILYRTLFMGIPGKHILELLNPGIPNSYVDTEGEKQSRVEMVVKKYNRSSSKIETLKLLHLILVTKIGRVFLRTGTIKLIAGSEWHKSSFAINSRKKISLIYGHSNDISKCIVFNRERKKRIQTNSITHLDAAGPMFATDSLLISRKTYLTIENWYPQLCRLFSYFEERFNFPVTIAGHYKSGFSSPSVIFGDRNVIYGRTLELVSESLFVTTRYSTATSMAVYFKKPVVFIYSNELMEDEEAMHHILGFSSAMNASVINIDDVVKGFEFDLSLDLEAYSAYLEKYLSSGPINLANFEIIAREFLQINS